MAEGATIDVQEFIDERDFRGLGVRVLICCFLVVAADGFDTSAIGFIAPTLKDQWGLGPAQLSVLFVSGLAGLTTGAFVFGPVADRVGRKKVLIATTAWFGVASLLSTSATGVETLAGWRFVVGLGLGGAMPMAITLTSEYSPGRRKSFLVTVMFCGVTVGGALGGLVSAGMVARYGWQGVLAIGGTLPLLLAAMLAALLPESVRYLASRGDQDRCIAHILARVDPTAELQGARFTGVQKAVSSPVGQLFNPGLVKGTLLVWLAFFMSLLVYYLLTNWLPILLRTAGQTAQCAALIALVLPLGSAVGAVGVGYLMDRLGPHVTLTVSYILAAAFILLLGVSANTTWLLVLAVFGAGVGTGGSNTGLNALAASFYPTPSRATGVSWANAVGRVGSLAGSALGGYLLSVGWGLDGVFATACIPPVIAALAIAAKGRTTSGPGYNRIEPAGPLQA